MIDNPGESLFGVVAANVAELRAQVEGDSGGKIRGMGGVQGAIPDLIRRVIKAMEEVLEWLYRTSVAAEQYVVAADAAIAALELLNDALEALGEGLSFGDMPKNLGLATEPFEKVSEAESRGREVLETGLAIAHLFPRTEDIERVQREVDLCLSTLRRLMQHIGVASGH